MRAQNHATVRDLVDEAKKRIVFLAVCVVGLSYIMSLTSSSVWVNLPAAALLIITIRYFSLDFDLRKKATAYGSKPSSENTLSQKKLPAFSKVVERFEWKRKVNSPIVEDAIDHFTRHLISEWVTDLWYSRLTPDKEGPEELINIINGALGEIAGRMRNLNLIDLLTRDLVNIICNHLENFRSTQAKIEKKLLDSLTIELREVELKRILASEDKLHPALFSVEAQHKVLQHLMDGLISFIFKQEDLQCSYFRFTARELLASAVMRPILNLVSPRFINERIEILVINMTKTNKGSSKTQEASQSKLDGSPRIQSDHFSRFLDPSVTGVELVQLKKGQSGNVAEKPTQDRMHGNRSKDPLLFIDTQSSRSWNSFPMNPQVYDQKRTPEHNSGGEWGDKLELFSRRKKQALAPENFENMWTKGKNYRKKEGGDRFIEHVHQGPLAGKSVTVNRAEEKNTVNKVNTAQSSTIHSGNSRYMDGNSFPPSDLSKPIDSAVQYYEEDDEPKIMRLEEDSGSCTSYTSEDEENNSVTGLDSPGTKVWDGRSNRNPGDSKIHHPLANSDPHISKNSSKGQFNYRRRPRSQSGPKRYRPSSKKVHVWQEVERTTFLSGDGQDILSSVKGFENTEGSSDDSEIENSGRVHSGEAASSSTPSAAVQETHSLNFNSLKNSLAVDSFYKLKCEVLGANIVKSGSRTFAVYSIAVSDVNNNSWSIKRRFRHFEELHRRLKEFPEYDLHLPPKHFLSTGLDVPVIRERCKLLDKYLKKLMLLPTVSGFIEVWDFLSVDSQTYIFSNSFSILETLSVDLDGKTAENAKKISNISDSATSSVPIRRENSGPESVDMQLKKTFPADGSKLNDTVMQKTSFSPRNSGSTVNEKASQQLEEASQMLLDATADPTLPTEWVPPNLSVPILDLVDVIFQLQDGGWIRRQAFWVAKQVLQLGMGDAFDDWLLEKIQLLRKGSVVAAVVQRLERILWPDGIFITKHPKRRPPPPPINSPGSMSSPRVIDEQQQQELDRRAKFVYELMIYNAPAAIVGLVGRREYEQCAKDLYYFLQSNVCLKQLAFDLIELLLLSTFPELDSVIKQLHEDKSTFGELNLN